MSVDFSEYTRQLRDGVQRNASSLGRLSKWIEKNTKHNGRAFSFHDHEYQIDIVDSRHNNVVTIKPSQVGMTEATIRFVLAFLAVESGTVALHILPTKMEAFAAVKSRFDPVIRGSAYLRSIANAGTDSASLKQFGESQLHSTGSFGKSIISIPTDLISVDEYAFCNMESIATAESRLTHSRFVDPDTGARGIKRLWSTPTAVGASIDGLYQQSDQRKRLVKCKHCGEWSWPSFLDGVVVQGWDHSMREMTYIDAMDLEARGLLSTAKLLCEHCHKPITKENLTHKHRSWVATYPNITYRQGYQVSPFDLPSYHTPESILRKMIDYRNNYSHFMNFVLGMAYSDASNSILDTKVEQYMTVKPVTPEEAQLGLASGCVAGLDVGRTSWLTIGKVNPVTGSIDIIWVEQIRLEGEEEDDLKTKVLTRLRQYRVIRFVCDSLPYTPSILSIQASMPEGWVLPNFYSLRDSKLPIYVVNPKDNVISSHRTKAMNLLCKKVNNGDVRWPIMNEMSTVRKHLQGSKRVDRIAEDGAEESDWVKTGDDHYFHSMTYLSLAAEMVSNEASFGWAPAPTIREVVVGSKIRTDSLI